MSNYMALHHHYTSKKPPTDLVRRRIQSAFVIIAQQFQRTLHRLADFIERRQRTDQIAVLPINL